MAPCPQACSGAAAPGLFHSCSLCSLVPRGHRSHFHSQDLTDHRPCCARGHSHPAVHVNTTGAGAPSAWFSNECRQLSGAGEPPSQLRSPGTRPQMSVWGRFQFQLCLRVCMAGSSVGKSAMGPEQSYCAAASGSPQAPEALDTLLADPGPDTGRR